MMFTNNASTKMNGSNVVEYKGKLYSVRWTNASQGYFLAPIKEADDFLGFWVNPSKCTLLRN